MNINLSIKSLILFVILNLLQASAVHAQQTNSISLDNHLRIVNGKAAYSGQLSNLNTKTGVYELKLFYPSGRLCLKGHAFRTDSLLLEGFCSFYYQNGKPMKEAYYAHGKLMMPVKFDLDNEKVEERFFFPDGEDLRFDYPKSEYTILRTGVTSNNIDQLKSLLRQYQSKGDYYHATLLAQISYDYAAKNKLYALQLDIMEYFISVIMTNVEEPKIIKENLDYFKNFVMTLGIKSYYAKIFEHFGVYYTNIEVNRAKAAENLYAALKYLDYNPSDTLREYLNYDLALFHLNQNQDSASYYFKKCIVYGEKFNDFQVLYQSYLNLGVMDYYKNDYEPSKKYIEQALEVGKHYDDPESAVRAHMMMARLAGKSGDKEEAGKHYKIVQELKERIPLRPNTLVIYEEILQSYYATGDNDMVKTLSAQINAIKGVSVKEHKTNSKRSLNSLDNNEKMQLGSIMNKVQTSYMESDFANAKIWARYVFDHYLLEDDVFNTSMALLLSSCYVKTQALDSAEYFIQTISEDKVDRGLQPSFYAQKLEIASGLDKMDNAATYFDKLLLLESSIEDEQEHYNAIQVMSQYAVKTNDVSKMIDVMERLIKFTKPSKGDQIYEQLYNLCELADFKDKAAYYKKMMEK